MRVVVEPHPSELRRSQILRAALELVLEDGVSGTTVEAIRDRSGASIGSIYHHYGSKDGVLEALSLDCLADYQRGFLVELRRRRSARGGIRAGVGYHLAWTQDHPDRARYLAAMPPARRGGEIAHSIEEQTGGFVEAVSAWLAPHLDAGSVRRLPVDEFSALWVGAAHHFCGQWLSGRTERAPRKVAPALADAAWAVLGS